MEEQIKEEVKTIVKKEKKLINKLYFSPKTMEVLKKAIETNFPVLLIGDTGTGKTALVRELAKNRGKELIRLNLTGQTGVDEILGKWLASPVQGTYWMDGLLIRAMKEGYWIVLDEINMALPEILSALHSLLDDDRKIVLKEKDGEIVRCHKDFRIFATMNPSDEYVGTKELNKAFLSRFPVVLDVDYSVHEVKILIDRSGIEEVDAKNLVAVANEIRHSKSKNLITCACSTRDLIYASMMMAMGLDTVTSLTVALINKAPREERKPIAKIIELITSKKVAIEGFEGSHKSIFDLLESAKKKMQDYKDISKMKDEYYKLYSEKCEEFGHLRSQKEDLEESVKLKNERIKELEQKLITKRRIKKVVEIKEPTA